MSIRGRGKQRYGDKERGAKGEGVNGTSEALNHHNDTVLYPNLTALLSPLPLLPDLFLSHRDLRLLRQDLCCAASLQCCAYSNHPIYPPAHSEPTLFWIKAAHHFPHHQETQIETQIGRDTDECRCCSASPVRPDLAARLRCALPRRRGP